MKGKELSAFRRLLRKAQGDRTQAEFAKDSGCSPATISKIFTADEIATPNIATLRRIAGAAYNGVTLRELLSTCGHKGATVQEAMADDASEILSARKKLCMNKRVRAGTEDIKNGFSELTENGPSFWRDLSAFLDAADTVYAVEDISYEVERTGRITEPDSRFPDAEEYVVVNISFSDKDFAAESVFGIYYSKTEGGRMCVFGAASDLVTLLDLHANLAMEVDESRYGSPDYDPQEMDPICVWSDKRLPVDRETPEERKALNRDFIRRVHEIKEGKGFTMEQAMIYALFGDPDAPKRVTTEEGIGFWLDGITKDRVLSFLENHKDSFVQSETEADMLEQLENNENLDKVFEGYGSDHGNSQEDHWGTAITNVIYRETDIRTGLWRDVSKEDSEKFHNRPCILFPQGEVWWFNSTEKALTNKSLNIILDGYARELGVEISDCWHMMEIEIAEDA